ncbi:MAG: pentapeptide repeat-containing protein, partial [Gammaproteobacteria bacterium]|nr:pentapeptide repeat-containing protein [Gammaproteobacteria bacterium]
DFSEAKLTGVNLSLANLTDTNFLKAYLYESNLHKSNFSGADLTQVNLTEANLTGANLTRTKLTGVNLTGANLYNTIGNGKEIKTIMTDEYIINYTDKILQIGCQQYPINDWFKFSDDEIFEMDDKNGEKALNFWKKWKPILQMILE